MSAPVRNYRLTDEMVEVILDRLSHFPNDPDVEVVGQTIAAQQTYDPNHNSEPINTSFTFVKTSTKPLILPNGEEGIAVGYQIEE